MTDAQLTKVTEFDAQYQIEENQSIVMSKMMSVTISESNEIQASVVEARSTVLSAIKQLNVEAMQTVFGSLVAAESVVTEGGWRILHQGGGADAIKIKALQIAVSNCTGDYRLTIATAKAFPYGTDMAIDDGVEQVLTEPIVVPIATSWTVEISVASVAASEMAATLDFVKTITLS